MTKSGAPHPYTSLHLSGGEKWGTSIYLPDDQKYGNSIHFSAGQKWYTSLDLPDGHRGCSLVWDFTCPDTQASSHLNAAVLALWRTRLRKRSPSKKSNFTVRLHTDRCGDWCCRRVGNGLPSPIQLLSNVLSRFSCSVSSWQTGNAVCITGTAE